MVKIYNGTNSTITVVTDDNLDLVIESEEFGEVNLADDAVFGEDTFYVQEEGRFYLQHKDTQITNADYEILVEG